MAGPAAVVADQGVGRAGVAVADHEPVGLGRLGEPGERLPSARAPGAPGASASPVARRPATRRPAVPGRRPTRSTGSSSTGSESCIARRPSPIARTARSGSAFHRAPTADFPCSAAVLSQSVADVDHTGYRGVRGSPPQLGRLERRGRRPLHRTAPTSGRTRPAPRTSVHPARCARPAATGGRPAAAARRRAARVHRRAASSRCRLSCERADCAAMDLQLQGQARDRHGRHLEASASRSPRRSRQEGVDVAIVSRGSEQLQQAAARLAVHGTGWWRSPPTRRTTSRYATWWPPSSASSAASTSSSTARRTRPAAAPTPTLETLTDEAVHNELDTKFVGYLRTRPCRGAAPQGRRAGAASSTSAASTPGGPGRSPGRSATSPSPR